MERALGVEWDVEHDVFTFSIANKHKPLMRRGILSAVSSIYDPLGFLAPVILTAKQILQHLCKMKVSWDETVPLELAVDVSHPKVLVKSHWHSCITFVMPAKPDMVRCPIFGYQTANKKCVLPLLWEKQEWHY